MSWTFGKILLAFYGTALCAALVAKFSDHDPHAWTAVLVVASVSGIAEGFDCIVEAITKVQRSSTDSIVGAISEVQQSLSETD
jgi:hypothetical protein